MLRKETLLVSLRFIISAFVCCVAFIIITYCWGKDLDVTLWQWGGTTALIVAVLFALKAYVTATVFGVGSFIGYAIHWAIIADQGHYITQKAGMTLLLVQLSSVLLAVTFQYVYHRFKLWWKGKR